MNETVAGRVIEPGLSMPSRKEKTRRRKTGSLQGYALIFSLIALGWLIRDRNWIDPDQGVGYWLGIVGASMMLALLLYPLRKRLRFLHFLGPTKVWFRTHMILGLVGPLLVLYHSNFQMGSINSRVALICMLLVAGSGIIGRHFYAQIHKGLYGQKTSLKELQNELGVSVDQSHGLANVMPQLVSRLDALSQELQGNRITQSIGIGRSVRWAFTQYFIRWSLMYTAHAELKLAMSKSESVASNFSGLRRSAFKFIRRYTDVMGRVAQFTFYERLFALWHVLHLPIFFMMILSALAHVLAVHMY